MATISANYDSFALNNNLFDSEIKVKRIPNRVSILVDSYPQGSSSSSSNTPVMYWS